MCEALFSFYLDVAQNRIVELSPVLRKACKPEVPEQLDRFITPHSGEAELEWPLAEGATVALALKGQPGVRVTHTEAVGESLRLYLIPLATDLDKFYSLGITANDLRESDPLREYWFEMERMVGEIERRSRELHHAERMASLGTLAAGVAHEINNPLAYIKSNLMSLQGFLQPMVSTVQSLLEIDGESAEKAKQLQALGLDYDAEELGFILEDLDDLLADLRDGGERIVTIVSGLKQFSHPSHTKQELTDLNEAIRVAIELSRNEFKYHVDLQTDLQPLPKVRANSSEITQVIVNLIVNASQAITDTGRIIISSQCLDDEVEIRVADTGCGITEEQMAKIFNPFFTTKEVGQGTGLGLSISHRIVKEHNGSISVQSSENEMTEFILRFPIDA